MAAALPPHDLAPVSAQPLVVCAGPLSPLRGQHRVLQAFHILKTYLCLDAHLALAGGTDDGGYMKRLSRFGAELSLSDVVFTGELTDSQLAALYQRAAVLIDMAAREHEHGHLVQALANGVPVVCGSGGREIVGAAGIAVEGLTPALAAEALARILGDPELRLQMSSASLDRARSLDDAPGRERSMAGASVW